MTKQRTYWHLTDLKRRPTDYDIATSRLLYYPDRGFEVTTPFSAWHERFGKGSALAIADWERFRDPRETTYTKYTELQKTKETFVDELLRAGDETGYDLRLDPRWVDVLDRTIAPLRYPIHGLQMVAGYIGHMAPSGRIVVTCLCQTADEMRRIQRFAYRMRQLQEIRPELGKTSRSAWEGQPLWQPLRRAVEQLLVTYDWGESLAALNLCLKPAFDRLFMVRFADLARAAGDDVLAKLLFSLHEDCRWHDDWTASLIRLAIEERPENRSILQSWIARWDPITTAALQALAPIFEHAPVPQKFAEIWAGVEASIREHRLAMGLLGEGS
jgi:toluene monooxygenase system protein E